MFGFTYPGGAMNPDIALRQHHSVSAPIEVDGALWRYELSRDRIIRFRRVGTPDRDITASMMRAPSGRYVITTDRPHAGDTIDEALASAIRALPPKR